ncbi:MAG: sigma-70 family RNA polymerase sigma factor [Planctomycetes bacterium]|nr:sigma-70 family RNA polymerase sigma factor [Planctomycetota bacterium]
MRSVPSRTNEAWVEALDGESAESASAVHDLQAILRRALSRVVGPPTDLDLDDLVQDSLARIVEHIRSFRGDSLFTTWAVGVAVRVAFTEIRRQRVRATRAYDDVEAEALDLAVSREETPGKSADRLTLYGALEDAIVRRLTDRQRLAVLAELRGIPTIEIAERLGTTQNALYKLVHDARRSLKRALIDAGFSTEFVRDTLMEGRR